MKVHEYQGKALLKKYNVPIQDGYVVEHLSEVKSTIERVRIDFNSDAVVVKAQIHAGGRGKGGGVKYSPTPESALENAYNLLGINLITHQTNPEGQKVRKLYITEAFDIAKEFYVAMTLDRTVGKDVFMVSTEGGVEIEKVAEETPEKIIKVWIDPLLGITSFQVRKLAFSLGLKGDVLKTACKLFSNIYKCYTETDASIIEINPLILTEDYRMIALDAKFNFDGNAIYRHPDIAKMRDKHEEDPIELEASQFNLNYIKLEGNVGCMVNGAGLAMATMDIIKLAGGEPANFLDVGGTANVNTVKNGFKIILKDPNVKAILINIFGGIVRCDRVANGVVKAVKELNLDVPVIVRLEGTNAIEAKQILYDSGVAIIPAASIQDAAIKAVKSALIK